MYEPAGNVRVVGGAWRSAEAFALLSWPWSLGPPTPSPLPAVSVAVGRGGVFFPGTVTVNSDVAREISTPCFCSTRNSSACAPGRGSSPGITYAAGPSVRAFRSERLVLGEKLWGGRRLGARFQDRALALGVEVAEEQLLVRGEVVQRGEQSGLLVVVVVALRPGRLRQRRILFVPGARVLVGPQLAHDRVGAAVAE